MHSEINS